MNRVSINLASRPFRNNTVVGAVFLGVAAAAIVATIYNGWITTSYEGRYQDLRTEETRRSDRLQALDIEERRLSKEIATRDFRRLMSKGQVAGQLILRRAFSWTLLFNKLEDVVPPEAMMTAIRPHISGDGIVIRVEGIAKNHGALIALEDALLKNSSFSSVYPASERRLNPSRPEISFVLQFDYVMSKAVPGPEAIAAGRAESPGQEAPRPTGGSGAPPAGGASPPSAAPSPAPGTGIAGAPVESTPPSGDAGRMAADSTPGSTLGTVGRDGRPRTPEMLARLMVAPGGFYPEPATSAATPSEPAAPVKKSKTMRDARPASSQGSAAPATVTPGNAGPATAAPAGGGAPNLAGPPGGSRSSAEGIAPAAWQDRAGASPVRPPAASEKRSRRPPRPGFGGRLKGGAPGPPEPIPATRLDVRLKFSASAVSDVYAALSRAHGVRFDLDPTVDRRAPVSTDLAGKNLKDAIAILAGLAGHRVVRIEDGVYRVVPLAGGEPLADRPIQEETLPATDVTP